MSGRTQWWNNLDLEFFGRKFYITDLINLILNHIQVLILVFLFFTVSIMMKWFQNMSLQISKFLLLDL